MRTVLHPGPVATPRIDIAPAAGEEIEVMLAPGIPLEEAVAQVTQGFDSAWLELEGAKVETLDYVIPDHAPDSTHVAWYSKTHSFGGPGTIEHLGMIVGRCNGTSFLHGHGVWTPLGKPQAMGHILAPRTVLAEPTPARGFGLVGARFDRLPDRETNFDLFQVMGGDVDAGFAAVRLKPNQDFATALNSACSQLGWRAARVHGLGSLIGAQFESGEVLESHATEFLITHAMAGPNTPAPRIIIVGIDGSKILSGRLTCNENPILITAELIFQRLET